MTPCRFCDSSFPAQPHGSPLQGWVWALTSLSSAPLLPEFCCSGVKILTAAICSKGSWGRKQKKKRMLAQKCLSCVSVHETTWEGHVKRSESPKMFDLYLAAPLYNGEFTF